MTESFALSLINTLKEPWVETGIDIAETSIDALLNNEILKEIPIVKTGISLCKAGIQVHDRFLLKQTINFVSQLNDGCIPENTLNEYRKRLQCDEGWAEKELEHILVLLDATVNVSQSTRLAKFYQYYVRGAINWRKFCELSEANLRIFETDIIVLKEIENRCRTKFEESCEMSPDYRLYRLNSIGFVKIIMPFTTDGMLDFNNKYSLTEFGKTFLQCSRER